MTLRARGVSGSGMLAGVILIATACSGAGDRTPPAEDASRGRPPGSEAITIWTDATELFLEHPAMIAGAPGEPWGVHVTRMADFQPVGAARLTLEFESPDGTVLTTVAESPARPGIYAPAPSLPSAGMYDLVITLEGAHLQDEIFVGPIQVFGSESEIPVLPDAEAVGISFLKEQQWPIDFATARVGGRVVASGVEVTGRISAAPGHIVEITAPVPGIVRWDLNRAAPVDGTWVVAGTNMVRLSPVGGDATFAGMQARAERLEREVARSERLVAAEAIPARRLEEARHDLELVQAQLEAMGANARLDAGPGADESNGYVLTLATPIDGAVVGRTFIPGQRVEAGATLLTILDPRELRLDFDVPAVAVSALTELTAATYTPEGTSEVRRTTRLAGIGATLDAVRRTVSATFLIHNADRSLKPGMLVTGRLVPAPPDTAALAVPSDAILNEDGLLVAYVQIAGESFERRAVTIGATDGQWTVVVSGVRRGEHVVTRGHYQIKLSSLNTSEISDHGHPH
jgi:RND family efflux transporter MFP subunit